MRKIFSTVTIALLISLAQGCSTKRITGHQISPEDVETLKQGKHTKETVMEKLSAPTIVSAVNPNVWYYVSRKVKDVPLSKPVAISQDTIKLEFDEKGNLINVSSELNAKVARYKFAPVILTDNKNKKGSTEGLLKDWIKFALNRNKTPKVIKK